MDDIVISSNELKQKNDSELPEKASDFANYTFWHYTNLSTANLILEGKSIYISNIANMNDLDEINIHYETKDFVHCLCFCNSNTEKIPMWYLYAGITGKGVSIGITPATMLRFIKSIKTLSTTDGNTILYKEKDFDIEYGWVFYRKCDNKSQVLYKRKWYSLEDSENFEKDNYFIKSYPWEYEKEFRIVIHNKTNKKYDKLVVNIEEIFEKLKIKLAPEISTEEFRELLPNLSGFKQFLSSMLQLSDLSINMNLCKRNYNSFIYYIDTDLKRKSDNQQLSIEELKKIFELLKPLFND